MPPTGYILVPYFPICSFYYEHDTCYHNITMPPSRPHQLLFCSSYSLLIPQQHYCTLCTGTQSCVPHSQTFNFNCSVALKPHSELGKEVLAFKSMFFVSADLTDGVNSATHISAFCFHSPLASLDLTSEMKAADLTGVLKGSSCRNWNRFPSSQRAIMC